MTRKKIDIQKLKVPVPPSEPVESSLLLEEANPASSVQAMRRRAEDMIREKANRTPENQEPPSSVETRRLLHELQVHQIELEMQNEELRRTHRALEVSQAGYFELYDLAPVGYFKLSEEGLILEANLTAANLLGVAKNHLVKQLLSRFIVPEDQDIYYLHRNLLFAAGARHVCEIRMMHRGGAPFWARMEAIESRDAENASVCLVVISDITEHKQMEQTLKERANQIETINNELESFVFSISHDLRTPLRAIDGFTKILVKNVNDKLDEEEKRKFNIIQDNAHKMGQLIDALLTFSRFGRQAVSSFAFNMEELVNQAWEECRNVADGRKIRLTMGDLPRAFGDRSLIKQVLTNLLSNAIKFTRIREDAVIEFNGTSEEKENIYCIKDNGIGFNMADYNKLFGVFQRLHGSEEYEGTGVGLAIARRIINKHGGRIWAEAEVSKGSAFYFSLPSAHTN